MGVVSQPCLSLVLNTLLRNHRAGDEGSRSAKPALKESDGLVYALVPSQRILDADIAVVVPFIDNY